MEIKGNEIHKFLSIYNVPVDTTDDSLPESESEEISTLSEPINLGLDESTGFVKTISTLYKEGKYAKLLTKAQEYRRSDSYIKSLAEIDFDYLNLCSKILSINKLTIDAINKAVKESFKTDINALANKNKTSNLIHQMRDTLLCDILLHKKGYQKSKGIVARYGILYLILRISKKNVKEELYPTIIVRIPLLKIGKWIHMIQTNTQNKSYNLKKEKKQSKLNMGDENVSFKDIIHTYNYIKSISNTSVEFVEGEFVETKIKSETKKQDTDNELSKRLCKSGTKTQGKFIIKKDVCDSIPDNVIKELQKTGIDICKAPLELIVSRLRDLAQRYFQKEIAFIKNRGQQHQYMAYSNRVVVVIPPYDPDESETEDEISGNDEENTTVIDILGIGDLMVIKNESVKYEAAEIGHIENVLSGEEHSREFRKLDRTEEYFEQRIETVKETEHDLQTTEKFEIEREISEQHAESMNIEASTNISASYGPTISVEANFGFGYDTSTERSERSASRYSKEITEKAVERIKEKVSSIRKRREIREVEETINHKLTNPATNSHLSGVYQYVDKTYRMQTYNYGKRMMLECIVPEPGAFLRYLRHKVLDISPPEPFTISISDIDEINYLDLASKWQVSDLPTPPEENIVVPYEIQLKIKDSHSNHTGRIKIPEGYRVKYALAALHSGANEGAWTVPSDFNPQFSTSFRMSLSGIYFRNIGWTGRHVWPPTDSEGYPLGEDVRSGELPITIGMVGGDFYEHLNVGIACLCIPTETRYKKWQIEVFTALYEGYSQLKSEYENKLAERASSEGIDIEGENPAINRIKERTELKKSIIEIMRNRHLGDQELLEFDNEGKPLLDFVILNQQKSKIDFFEKCFEWENITFGLFPYFWTGKERWDGIHSENDPDPAHKNFLQAGVAKVKIPVTPGEEARVLYYFDFNDIWTDPVDPPPFLETRSSLVSIFNDWKDKIQANPNGIPVGNSWCVRVPTSLIILKESNGLPNDWISLITQVNEQSDSEIEDEIIE